MKKALVAVAAAVLCAELLARLLGIGDLPVLVRDDEIEYFYKPSTSHRVLGKRIAFNSHSMRSQESDRFRVLVLGDSVVNGGVRIDQDDIATSILERKLGAAVGNVSAGTWGPQNMLAYAKRHGFFSAEVVVIVLSSHDYLDAPTFGEVPSAPLFALEALFRKTELPSKNESTEAPLRELLRLAKSKARVIVAQHRERNEVSNPGFNEIAAIAAGEGVKVIQLALPQSAYRDSIHPNEEGHRLIAETLFKAITVGLPASL